MLRGKAVWGPSRKQPSAGHRGSQGTSPADTSPLDRSLPAATAHVCCVSRPLVGILLCGSHRTKTRTQPARNQPTTCCLVPTRLALIQDKVEPAGRESPELGPERAGLSPPGAPVSLSHPDVSPLEGAMGTERIAHANASLVRSTDVAQVTPKDLASGSEKREGVPGCSHDICGFCLFSLFPEETVAERVWVSPAAQAVNKFLDSGAAAKSAGPSETDRQGAGEAVD